MKWFYLVAVLFVCWSCSKERIDTCGLVGEWLCCGSSYDCIVVFQGEPFTEMWTFEDNGDLNISGLFPHNEKWNTDESCTELVINPHTEDEYKLKFEINGDNLVLHYVSVVGDRTFCRQ